MDSNIILSLLYGIMFVAGVSLTGTEAHQRNCNKAEFWNSDAELCVPCSECVEFPKTPSCDTCTFMDDTSYAWKLAAITSFSGCLCISTGLGREEPYVSLLRRPQDLCIKYNPFRRV
ncbi:hypothetical protein AGOR_G00096220 [Albula goreensis]|uniref:TNFR-Cys domain-containing protein n=1 Tax=Albula goreensis TaxID=1534307 RepID=A0A8T3DGG4_9TELE|nr:hypothetical protein AGOR_G00096220 [Albula goreensis]